MPDEEVLDELSEISGSISCNPASNLLAAVKKAGERSTFHVAILGEFKRGKSSLINSLFRKQPATG